MHRGALTSIDPKNESKMVDSPVYSDKIFHDNYRILLTAILLTIHYYRTFDIIYFMKM